MLTSDPQPDHLLLACRDGSLPRTDWTHEAHLAVARVLLDEAGDPDVALGELRGLITSYNARSGLPDDRIICHETITRYYLGAVIALRHLPLDEVAPGEEAEELGHVLLRDALARRDLSAAYAAFIAANELRPDDPRVKENLAMLMQLGVSPLRRPGHADLTRR